MSWNNNRMQMYISKVLSLSWLTARTLDFQINLQTFFLKAYVHNCKNAIRSTERGQNTNVNPSFSATRRVTCFLSMTNRRLFAIDI